jgi:hypothetical protein
MEPVTQKRRFCESASDSLNVREKLVITEGTVETHVMHLMGKLGFRSRTQVARCVAREGPASRTGRPSRMGVAVHRCRVPREKLSQAAQVNMAQ